MGNNLVHINAENYLESNRANIILAREEVFLNLYYKENNIKNEKNNSQKNHEILKNFDKKAQIEFINSHKKSKILKRYIRTTFFFNFNIPEIKKIIEEKINSKDLFDESDINIKSLNIFGIKLFNIVKKYINSIIPEELKFISEEPLFYFYINQLYKPLNKEEIIFTIYDFFLLADLSIEELSQLFNVKIDSNLKEQMEKIKEIKKNHFTTIKKIFDKENKMDDQFFKWFSIIASILVLLTAIFIYKYIIYPFSP